MNLPRTPGHNQRNGVYTKSRTLPTVNPTSTTQAQYNGRLDANLRQNDHLAFAIYWVPITTTDYQGPIRSANLWHHSQVNDAFSLIWNHTFTPTLLNQARANAAGWRWNEVASNPQEPFGLPQDNIGNVNDSSCGGSACSFGTANFQYFGAPGPTDLNQWTYDSTTSSPRSWAGIASRWGGSHPALLSQQRSIRSASLLHFPQSVGLCQRRPLQ